MHMYVYINVHIHVHMHMWRRPDLKGGVKIRWQGLFTYIQAMALHIHTQGSFDNHTVHSFTGSFSQHHYCGCD